MKLLLTGPFLILTLLSNAQSFTIGMQAGNSFGHALTAGFNVGINFKDFNIRTGLDQHLSNKVTDGTVFKSSIGHTFDIGGSYYITASIGHAYVLQSMDRKDLNHSEFLINPEFGYKWTFKEQAMGTYLSFSHAGDLNMVSIGIRGLWGNNYSN